MVSDEVPARTLEGRSVEAVAKYIKEKDVRKIVVMVRLLLIPCRLLLRAALTSSCI